jgi:SNF family Na+-dependent transporter
LTYLNERSLEGAAAYTSASCRKEHSMLDVIMLAIGLGFFALSVGYTITCDRL